MLRQIFQFENISVVAPRELQDIHIARNGKVLTILFLMTRVGSPNVVLSWSTIRSLSVGVNFAALLGLKKKERKIVSKINVLEIAH